MSFAAMAKGIPPSMHAAAGSGILIPLRASFFFLPRTLYLLLKDSQALLRMLSPVYIPLPLPQKHGATQGR